MLALASSGCDVTDPSSMSSVSLKVDKSNYSVGDTIHFALENRTAQRYTTNPCFSSVLYRNGIAVDPQGTTLCTASASLIDPGTIFAYPVVVTSKWGSGTFYSVLTLRADQTRDSVAVPSESFQVR